MATDEEEKPSVGSFITGLTIPEQIYDATTSLQKARQDGFDYVVTALPYTVPLLTTPTSSNDGSNSVRSDIRTDVTRLESKWWSTSVVGMVVDPPQWNNTQQTKSKPQSPSTPLYDSLQGIKLRDALTSTSSTDIEKKVEATKIFMGMLEWSAHMNIPAVILPSVPLAEKKIKSKNSDIHSSDEEDIFAEDNKPCPAVSSIAATEKTTKLSINSQQSAKEYTRLISNISTSSICTSSHVQLWIRVPLNIQSIQSYQLLLSKCNYVSSVGCILCVDDHTTPINNPSDLSSIIIALHGLIGSGHIKAISWSLNVFLMNKKGYPTLSKCHQAIFSFVYGRLGRTIRTLLEGSLPNSNNINNSNMNAGTSLRLHLRSKSNLLYKLDNTEAILETPYLDNLQSPLQPLGDHLEYQTYETFEKDPVKYRNYGLAVEYALLDGLEENKFSTVVTSSNEVDLYEVTILVVGAGRGPLVRESISAVSRVSASLNDTKVVGMQQRKKGLHAKIIAIEKNPSAVLYLQSLKGSDPSWNGGRDYDPYNSSDDQGSSINKIVPGTSNVSVIGCDMREANSHSILKDMTDNVKSRGDIVVSELLGSFGDNELSPECLDGVQQCGILKDGCVSIPQNYTAYIAPVSSARLYCEARNQACFPLNTNEGPASPSVGMQRALETPYVVRSHAASQTHAEQACWTYTHPHQSKTEGTTSSSQAAMNINNDRHAHLSFQHDPTHGVGFGCGYGALDSEVASMASSTSDGDDTTTITLHGLLGSFHSVLYESKKRNDKSTISIAPASFSVGMFSWFPLYFPLKEPLRVPNQATVNCSIWRRSDNERVWYEWCAEVVSKDRNGGEGVCWASSSMHNTGGRSYHVKK